VKNVQISLNSLTDAIYTLVGE